jgi:2-amino-4-hydroxy-6-hydroxymethyldihydropteridine diphosphokinase
MDTNVFLLLGTNEGDRQKNLENARNALKTRVGPIVRQSSVYRTAAWGNTSQPDFYNQVIELKTGYHPFDLLEITLSIEHELGRVRFEKWGPRTIDIDILFYADHVITTEHLQIPHPAITERRFTLIPLNEIAPDLIHPVLQKPVSLLLEECQDHLPVEVIPLKD